MATKDTTSSAPLESDPKDSGDSTASTTAASSTSPDDKAASGPSKTSGGADPREAGANQDWAKEQLEKRVAKLTAQKKDLEARVAAGTSTAGERTQIDQNNEAIIEARAEAKAVVKAAQREYDRQANAAVEAGRETYGSDVFNAKVGEFRRLYDPADAESVKRYTALTEAAFETGSPEKIIFELGGNLQEAERIMNLSPVKQAVALAKLAAKGEKTVGKETDGEADEGEGEARISSAPKPITPISRRGAGHEQITPSDPTRADRLSTQAWMERRNAEAEVYNKKAGRRVI